MPSANLYRIIVRAGAEQSGVGTLAVALGGVCASAHIRRHLSVAIGTLAVALRGVCIVSKRIPVLFYDGWDPCGRPPGSLHHLSVAVGTLAVALWGIRYAHTASLKVERIPHDE